MNKLFKQYYVEKFFDCYRVDDLLKSYISNYTYFSISNKRLSDNYLHPFPNGNIEIYLHIDESNLIIRRSNQEKRYKSFLVGLFDLKEISMIKPQTANELYRCVLVSIKLGDILKFLNMPLYALRNKIFNLFEVWEEKGTVLEKKISRCEEIQQIVVCLNQFFIDNLNDNLDYKRRKISEILHFCASKQSILTVDEICKSLKISYRSFHRIFTSEIGMCPKEYLEIIRFNRVCKLLNKFPDIEWTDLVYSCGYYDQSHFIRDFKSIMKCTPEKFIEKTSSISYFSRPFIFDS